MSFRIKLLLGMVLLPTICLLVFLSLSVVTFVDDKKAFVYEWNQLQSRYIASQIDLNLMRMKNDPQEALFVAHVDSSFNNVLDVAGRVQKDQAVSIIKTYAAAMCSGLRSITWIEIEGRMVYTYCHKVKNNYELFAFDRSRLEVYFAERGISENILVGYDGYVIAGPPGFPIGRELTSIVGNGVKDIFDTNFEKGRVEIKDKRDGETYLLNFYRIPNESLLIVSLTARSAPERAAYFFVYRGIIFAVALMIITIMAALFASGALIRSVVKLRNAMQNFGAGQMDVHLEVGSKDEVGQLAGLFNDMVTHIKQLMTVHEEKARIDAEMVLASDLQRKFFPLDIYSNSKYQFAGFYEPASQCGGDWWTYVETEDHFIVCICDVTGHGLQSALITSAACAVVASFKSNLQGPAQLMQAMNRAVFETSRGALNMTCLIASFNKRDNTMTYCNASHEPTYFFTPRDGMKRTDIKVFEKVNGPRLGESLDAEFSETSISFEAGSVFLFYSDGLKDIVNSENKAFEERRILKVLTKVTNDSIAADAILNMAKKDTNEWRGQSGLIDDLSYFIVKHNPEGPTTH
ncbi:SpoIIE family protein phosphatase [Bdellovibrio sp. HCB185ZH]|uniref:SpoIIE family protein phosphatase n=1 Tax=Bdellovibrio sp. HCB185ZH TaxID=3394235 RepID=UPI0039A67BB4